MSEKKLWKDEGYTGSSYNAAMPFLNSGHEHQLVNTETGEQKTIHVCSNQTLGEAIRSGEQWTEEAVENENECLN
ncbi:MAG: hypothetical protein ABI954_04545 [Pyrinomonadaceae bacterium]